jgi:hypothetical protein
MIWLVVYQPPWKKYEFVSWGYEIPNIWTNKYIPNHLPVINVSLNMMMINNNDD